MTHQSVRLFILCHAESMLHVDSRGVEAIPFLEIGNEARGTLEF
jgi:hypothetical protein